MPSLSTSHPGSVAGHAPAPGAGPSGGDTAALNGSSDAATVAAYRAIFDLSAVGIVQVQFTDGRVMQVNSRYCQILGYTPDQLMGQTIGQITHPDDRLRDADALKRMSEGSLSEYAVEKRYLHRDGSIVWGHLTAALVRDAQGRPVRSIGVLQDITQRRRAEEALAHSRRGMETQRQLAHRAQATTVGELAAQIAHEVNQPLAAIAGFVQGSLMRLRKVRGVPPEILRAMEQAGEQAQRAGEIIRRMRKLSGRDGSSRFPIEINPLIQHAVRMTTETRDTRGVSVELELAPNLPTVSADRTQIEQVVVNLLNNALDAVTCHLRSDTALRRERRVTVRSSLSADRCITVAVADTGPGLVGIDADKIFEPFVTTKPGGLGMGLSICRSIMEAHGGRLSAAANPGGGMIFQFTLPLPDGARHAHP